MEIKSVKLGAAQINKIYVGENLNWMYEAPDTTPPITNLHPDPTNVQLTHYAGQEVRFEVNEMCNTYYTLDGTEPTTASTKYTEAIVLNETTTFKYFSVDLAGNAEAVKTTVFDITSNLPVTTVSPSEPVQNVFPILVTLSAINATTTYYKIGAGTQQTYTAPFEVSQDDVWVTNISVTYWSVGAEGTEAEKVIYYETAGALAGQPVVSVTNGNNQVILDWETTVSTIAYTVYRSTVFGDAGAVLAGADFVFETTWTDTTAINDTTYYYLVQAGNLADTTNSVQVEAKPTAAPIATTWRYVRYVGHGDNTSTTSRLVELQALEGATNRLLNKLPNAGYPAPNGGAIAVATNGEKVQSSGYPLWWSGEGIPDMYYDMGAEYPIDTINVTGFSSAIDQRQTQFKVYVSKNATDWTLVKDHSLNTTPQPVDGFYFDVPQ